MSEIVDSQVGRFRRVQDGQDKLWLWECPNCKQWCRLSEKQWNGEESVQCGDGIRYCGYHQTHAFGPSLVAAIQANILCGFPASHEDTP